MVLEAQGDKKIDEEIVYTVAQVAKILHVNRKYVYRLINNGILPTLKFKSYRIRKKSLEDFLKEYENIDLSNIWKVNNYI